MIKAKVANIFQQGSMHLVKLTPLEIAAGDILLGFETDTVKVTHHEPTFFMDKSTGLPGKAAIRENDHAIGLEVSMGGKTFTFEQDAIVDIDFS
jgi:hypothetical protein